MANELKESQRQEIAALLNRRGASEPCPRCRFSEFIILEMPAIIPIAAPLQINAGTFTTNIQTVLAICGNCGFVSQHVDSVLKRE